MPYIEKNRREELVNAYNSHIWECNNSGELNFLLTHSLLDTTLPIDEQESTMLSIVLQYYKDADNKNYQVCNDIMGAITGCKMEWTRRMRPTQKNGRIFVTLNNVLQELYKDVISKYEDLKISANGDVYEGLATNEKYDC